MSNTDYGFVLSSPVEETLPPYTTTWGQDTVEKEPVKSRTRWHWWKARYAWLVAQQKVTPTYEQVSAQANLMLNSTWHFLARRGRASAAQWIALLLLLVFGVMPMVLLGTYMSDYGPFYQVFQDKVLSCGDSFGTPENATISGIEKVFLLDKTFGRFSFSAVKTIDVAWDILVGRGLQMIAWYIGYVVFSDALLRAIERHPTSFQIFQRIALEGPSLLSLWTLLHELWNSKSKRTKALFLYMWLATLYILAIPMFVGAMTGYDSTSTAWVNLDDSSNIVPAAAVVDSGYVSGTWDKLFDKPVCIPYDNYTTAYNALYARDSHCDCRLDNGTVLGPSEGMRRIRADTYSYAPYKDMSICKLFSWCLLLFFGHLRSTWGTNGQNLTSNYRSI